MTPALVITLLALAVGLSVGLMVWLLSQAVAEVPQEDREYKDPPPLGFRLAWWPIQRVAYFLKLVWPAERQEQLMATLRKAGLDYQLSPAQFLAARLVAAWLGGALTWLAAGSFDIHGTWGWTTYWQLAAAGAAMGYFYPSLWLRDRLAARRSEFLKTLPFFLDIITLCVEAGLNLQGAIAQAVAKGPQGVLREEFQRVMRDIRAGKSRADSLRAMAERVQEPGLSSLVSVIVQAEGMGMTLGPVLRAQAEQRRSERFIRAEKLAMQAPVKMLFPLIAFIFPCTFIVLFFPIAMRLMHSGL
jgi:tight adherence protein C